MRKKPIIYICGKYSDSDKKEVTKNINKARKVAIQIWDMGAVAICPHLNTAYFDILCKKAKYNNFLNGYLNIIEMCNGLFLLDNWRESKGSKKEKKHAQKWHIDIFYEMEDLEDYLRKY